MSMRFTSGISGSINAQDAVAEACEQVLRQLAGLPCHLAWVFASTIYRASWPELLRELHQRLQPAVLLGSSGSGIIGGAQELEWVPAISIVAAHLPDVRLFPFAVHPDEIERSSAGGFWVDKIGAAPATHPAFVLFIDPYTANPTKLIDELNATYRGCPIIGGLVSGGHEPGEQFTFLNTEVYREGAVGVAMTGNIQMEPIISQGCRPIGQPWVVTEAEENLIRQLGGRPALEVLHEMLSALSLEERELAQRGSIFLGLVVNEVREAFTAGDFLIRNLIGIDPESGSIAVADRVHVGQTVQFQLRDPATSRQQLRRLLHQSGQAHHLSPPVGCLLFNCTGRGKSLYGVAHQDVRTIQTISGKVPLGGFFCNGEIGPIGGTNFVHGYTASLGLFRPLDFSAPRT